MTRILVSLVFGLSLTLGCSDSSDSGPGGASGAGGAEAQTVRASIVYTEFGIPHITADDWAGLGFGQGYAYARENFCVLMREIVSSNGQAARYFGENRASADFVFTWLNEEEAFAEYRSGLSDEARDLYRGYAAGLNRFLEERGLDGLPEGDAGCRGAEWVRPVTEDDLIKRSRKLILASGTSAFPALIVAASDSAPTASMASAQTAGPQSVALDLSQVEMAKHRFGSNAYAVGAAGSQSGRGVLLGNPHFPWSGPERFFVKHLTIPGEYDVFGGSLHGAPFVMIGFNKDLAWSHTTSTSPRFSFYELELLEDDPFRYRFDDEVREIEAVPVTIEVMLDDGTIEEQTKNIYLSHYGPMLDLAPFNGLVGGWPTTAGTAFTFRDANIDNARFADQFVQMGQSGSIEELEVALANIGLPWVNTTAADRNGDGFYGDITTAANIPEEKLDACAEGLAGLVNTFGFTALNGSRSECDWDSDPGAPEGLFSFENLPKLRTSDDVPYVGNANDSYWLANPNQPLEGFSPVMGGERTQRSLRTRQLFVQAEERLAGTDGLSDTPGFTVDLMREVMYGNRNLGAELMKDDLVALCSATDWSEGDCDGAQDGAQPYSVNPAVAAEACDILDAWDGLYNLDSVGPSIFQTFLIGGEFGRGAALSLENLWAVPFDADDPVGTPNTLNVDDPDGADAIRCSLGAAVDFLVAQGVPIDRPWGEVQFWKAGDARIPLHGGNVRTMFSAIDAGFEEGEGYTRIRNSNSYIQTVTWDDSDCPDAYAVLTYSQSTDPASAHFIDMTELYSGKGWVDVPFCESDVEAMKISEIEIEGVLASESE